MDKLFQDITPKYDILINSTIKNIQDLLKASEDGFCLREEFAKILAEKKYNNEYYKKITNLEDRVYEHVKEGG